MFDAIKAANEMKQAGMAADIANAVAHAIFESNKTVDTSHLATREGLTDLRSDVKEDIGNFKADVKEDIANLKEDISNFKSEIKEDIANFKSEIKEDISNLATKDDLAKLESTVNELAKDVSSIKTAVSDIKYDIIKWVVPLFLTSIGITITLFFKH